MESVTLLQFIDKSKWVSWELLGEERKYLRPLSHTEVSCRSSFLRFLMISLSARRIKLSEEMSELPYRMSSSSRIKCRALLILYMDLSVMELSARFNCFN